jgi:hypothetical protein
MRKIKCYLLFQRVPLKQVLSLNITSFDGVVCIAIGTLTVKTKLNDVSFGTSDIFKIK